MKTPLESIKDFLHEIGIPCRAGTVREDSFLAGIDIQNGQIIFDEQRMLSCGDLLHEAGHISVLKSEDRKNVTSPNVSGDMDEGGAEMGAIAWSWAALKHLDIAPEIVFHKEGYKGSAENIIENFSNKRYFGVSILGWLNMTTDPTNVSDEERATKTIFPKMSNWLRPD